MKLLSKLTAPVASLSKRQLILISGLVVISLVIAVALFFLTRPAEHAPVADSSQKHQKTSSPSTKDWSAVTAQIAQAEQLVNEDKLDEATALLADIDTAYPAYDTVTALLDRIKTKQAQLAEQSATQSAPRATTPVAPTPQQPALPQFSTHIAIRGDASCQADTLNALRMIAGSAPGHYAVVTRYISVIECVPSGSAMYADETPPRYAAGDATRNAGTQWYASTIVHDANHSRLYAEGKDWTGRNAEDICLDAQISSLAQMGASQSTIDYVNSMKNDPYWQTPVGDRYW